MQTLASLSPAVTVHLFAALGALLLGPLAIWVRLVGKQRPKLHRAFGYAWVTLMIVTALTALFIPSAVSRGSYFSWIHLFIPATVIGLGLAFWFLARGNIRAHRWAMINLYVGACVIAGAFTVLPGRFLGQFIWN